MYEQVGSGGSLCYNPPSYKSSIHTAGKTKARPSSAAAAKNLLLYQKQLGICFGVGHSLHEGRTASSSLGKLGLINRCRGSTLYRVVLVPP